MNKLNRGLALVVCALVMLGCGGKSGSTKPAPEPPPEQAQTKTLAVQFAATLGGQALACGQVYPNLGTSRAAISVQDLRFYAHNFQVQFNGGDAANPGWVEARLPVAAPWQSRQVALVSLLQQCDSAAPPRNDRVTLEVSQRPSQTITGLCFDLGVPEALNHQNNALAEAPLNSSGMFWVWQSGYKFFRWDFQVNPGDNAKGFNLHLGSTGCQSASAITPPNQACQFPNRPRICLRGFDPARNQVALRLEQLVEAVDLSRNTANTPPGCMSGNNDPECISLLPKLGVDFTFNDGVASPVVYPAAAVNSVFSVQ